MGFRPDDPDLRRLRPILDFDAFEWREEDEPIVSHPHDPFGPDRRPAAAAATYASSTTGRLLAESSRPALLFETLLPVRMYLPREDVVVDLQPSDTVSYCAYKGPRFLLLGARRSAATSRGPITSRCMRPSRCATASVSSTSCRSRRVSSDGARTRSARSRPWTD